jgi:dihydroorotase
MSGFVDLDVTLRLPGAPDDEAPAMLARRAREGGVDLLVVGIDGAAPVDAVGLAATAAMLRAASPSPLLVPAVRPLRHDHLADLGSVGWRAAVGAPLRPVWRLLTPVDDALLLRRVGELARAHDAVVIVPSVDGGLSAGAIAVEGAIATRLGIPAMPEAAEAIGVARIIELARLTGASFHIVGVFTAAGARLIADAAGLVSGSVRPPQLLFDESALLACRYDSALLRSPPLPTASSRVALVEAVRRGVLMVSSGHTFVPRRERDLELSRATPGGTSLSSTARLLRPLLGDEVLATAWRDAPRRLLGLPPAPAPLPVPANVDDDLSALAALLPAPLPGARP